MAFKTEKNFASADGKTVIHARCWAPENGSPVAVLQICGVSYKDGYKHLFVVTVVITLMALALSVIMGNILYPIAA